MGGLFLDYLFKAKYLLEYPDDRRVSCSFLCLHMISNLNLVQASY